MRYKAYRPDGRQTLIDLARALLGPIYCHRDELATLAAAGVIAKSLLHGGPLRGELWKGANDDAG